jgi:CRP/FNR family cyclic AMP-dependent transcriptional regulator
MQASTPRKLDDARKLLAECVLFRGLSEKERDSVVNRARVRSFAAGETIFLMGDAGDSMMAVLKGTVRISTPTTDGKEIVLAIMQPREFFGEIALLDGKERSADARAMTACTLAILDRREVMAFLEHNQSAWFSIVDVLCERLRRTTVQITEVALLELPVRLAKALLRMARAEEGTTKGAPLQVRLSQRELGYIVGATRESVNKALREWQRSGMIQIEGIAIVIKKPVALEALADSVEQ